MWVAQIITGTGYVIAVVDMREPIPVAPAGRTFVQLTGADDAEAGGTYSNGVFTPAPKLEDAP